MLKGLYSQSACVLLEEPVSLQRVTEALSRWSPRLHEDPSDHWAFGTRPAVILSGDPDVPRIVEVDVVPHPWPDAMGSGPGDPVFDAWVSQAFGPFAWPGALHRAVMYSYFWEDAAAAVDQHGAFLRIRCVHASVGDEALDRGAVYDPLAELLLVAQVAEALLGLPAALAWFNPNGETLRDRDGLRQALAQSASSGLPPLPLWCNVRAMNVAGGWGMMDTVGNGQLGLADVEVCFPAADGLAGGETIEFLYQTTGYLLQHGEVIGDGDTMDGVGDGVWRARHFASPLSDPARRVICFVPADGSVPPRAVLDRAVPGSPPAPPAGQLAAESAPPPPGLASVASPAPARRSVLRPERPWWKFWG